MDLELFIITITISLFMFLISLYDSNFISQSVLYNKISTKVKNINSYGNNYKKLLGSNKVGSYVVPFSNKEGINIFGCYETDNEGVIYLLQCGTGDGCYFRDDSNIDKDNLCSIATKYIETRIPCNSKFSFNNIFSNCSYAYLQNSIQSS